MTEDSNKTNCMPCRLIGGLGVIGIGLYVYSQARHSKSLFSIRFIQSLGIGISGIGIARLLDLPPFGRKTDLK